MIAAALKYLRNAHDRLRQTEQIYMVLVSVVIGLLGGLCAVGFRLLIQSLNRIAWHQGPYTLEYISSLPAWWKILVPAAGGLIVGLITFRYAREAKGHGVPEVMEGMVFGLQFRFLGLGAVNDVRLRDGKGDLVYQK